MEDFSKTRVISDEEITKKVTLLLKGTEKSYDRRFTVAQMMGMIDLTTLEGADTQQKVEGMCKKGREITQSFPGFPNVAAVCVYPTLVSTARKALEGSDLQLAAVAGAFPAGQSPLGIKLEEVRYTVNEGANEIDMVISRGKFLEGEYALVFDEIAAIKEACAGARLKVILETGELKTSTLIRRASEIAIKAGADFIKTSTGKVQPAATLNAMLVMLEAIRDHYQQSGIMVGIKPAGGISDADTALTFYLLTREILGERWLHKKWMRFGASRLVDALIEDTGPIQKEHGNADTLAY